MGGHAVVATRSDIETALAAGAATLVTAAGMAHAAGPAWYEHVLRLLTPTPPAIVFDVGDDAAFAHTLCAAGRQVVFTGPQRFRAILTATFPGLVWRGIARSGRLR